jgi:two-component system KDP operon response regulator KdpE
MKILIIEDDIETIEILRFAFQLNWPEASIDSSRLGIPGISKARKLSPDVIILDLGLPDISGFDVLKLLREQSEKPVIVILSVIKEEAKRQRAFANGANSYITKPFKPNNLITEIKSQVNAKREHHSLTK